MTESARDRLDPGAVLAAVFGEILEEADSNPTFARNLMRALGREAVPAVGARKRGGRRAPGAFDPFEVYGSTGDKGLREKLAALDTEAIKDIVAEHGMDTAKLAMKWKSQQRLIDFVAETVAARAKKGQAFLGDRRRDSGRTHAAPQRPASAASADPGPGKAVNPGEGESEAVPVNE